MIIECTNEQVQKMAALACNTSKPVGMGWLHYNPTHIADYREFEHFTELISIDYWHGRMVKFHARKLNDNEWKFNDQVSTDYQSWSTKYPSYQALFDAIK